MTHLKLTPAEEGVSLDIENYCTVGLFFEQPWLSQQGVLPRYTPFSGDLTLIG
ncbi:hypothetical protein NEE94_005076 [Salmonella enterica]|nr:hypothetical protein [Salmonella enterica]